MLSPCRLLMLVNWSRILQSDSPEEHSTPTFSFSRSPCFWVLVASALFYLTACVFFLLKFWSTRIARPGSATLRRAELAASSKLRAPLRHTVASARTGGVVVDADIVTLNKFPDWTCLQALTKAGFLVLFLSRQSGK